MVNEKNVPTERRKKQNKKEQSIYEIQSTILEKIRKTETVQQNQSETYNIPGRNSALENQEHCKKYLPLDVK